jgi:hypothetical protein
MRLYMIVIGVWFSVVVRGLREGKAIVLLGVKVIIAIRVEIFLSAQKSVGHEIIKIGGIVNEI